MNHAQLSRLGARFRQRHEQNRLAREQAESHAATWRFVVTVLTVLVGVGVGVLASV